MKKRIVLASSNAGKIKEFKEILSDYEIVPMSEAGFSGEIIEDGKTFYENSLKKAKTVADLLNVPVIADDSGLCVTALGGAPGVFSARYSGGGDAENRKLLLKNMQGITDRSAKFICVLSYVEPNGKTVFAEGETEGYIGETERGENGFGYDRVFISKELGKCLGVATAAEKNSVSHRARAIKALADKL